MLRELRELRPTIVHFRGHGARSFETGPAQIRDVAAASSENEPGMVFGAESGSSRVVTPEAIAEAFGAVDAPVRVVLLNACYSAPAAEALLAHVDCVVGMTGAIHDDAARSFAIGFYGGLGEHESVAAAFAQGKAAIRLDRLLDADQPQFRVRDGFDASKLILAAILPSVLMAVPCPYPGMRPFAADDAESFRGREAEIAELIGRLRAGQREIFVIGPSGSGKSSLVRAGVLPRLARGLSGLGQFVIREVRPGDQPFSRLCQALDAPPGEPLVAAERVAKLLAHRAPGASLLIVIDQLEELFTQASTEALAVFLDALCTLRSAPRCVVIFTLRADFSGALMESPLWPQRPGQISRVEVTPLRGEELREAIAAPARTVGVTVEPELIERLLADAASEPGILPLLQETLVQLWDVRADQTLTLTDYQALGDGVRSGLAVALARRADATLQRFTPAQIDIARRIFLRLISFGEGRSDTRRQQPRMQLRAVGENEADFGLVLQMLVDGRLLTVDDDIVGEPRVDLAHEIMISAWPTLVDWIRSHRVDEQRRRRLEAAAAEWAEHGRGTRGVLDPIELADAELWQQTESAVQLGQSAQVMALIVGSRAAQTRQRTRRRRQLGGAFAVLTIVTLITAMSALLAYRRAEQNQRLLALSYQEAGAWHVHEGQPQAAIPLLVAAREKGQRSTVLQMLFGAASRSLPVAPPLAHGDAVVFAAFSVDGTRIVTASEDHSARVWNAITGDILAVFDHQAAVISAEFSSDGRRVVTASADHTACIWDVATGRRVATLKHNGIVMSAVFSFDGTRVVTGSADKTARVWDVATGNQVSAALEHQGVVSSAAFSADGVHVVTASWDRTVRVWDAATGKAASSPLLHPDQVTSAAFNRDGTRVVTASGLIARVWNTVSGQPDIAPLVHNGHVTSVAFNHDGTRVVTSERGGSARVWDAISGQPVTMPLKHQATVYMASFSADGMRIVTASDDHTAQVWNAVTGQPIGPALIHLGAVNSAAFSPDNIHVVTASDDHMAYIWDISLSNSTLALLGHQGQVTAASFNHDGRRIVTAGLDGVARIWDATTGKPAAEPMKHRGFIYSATFSSDGTRIVTASEDRTARLWNAATGKLLATLEHQETVIKAAFSPDGQRVVTASYDGTARIWDATSGKPLTAALRHDGLWSLTSAAFSPDGSRVVTTSWGGTARLWDAFTGKLLVGPLRHQGFVFDASFSPDSRRIVTASDDLTARVWDAATGQLLAEHAHQGGVMRATFSPDGMRVVTASADHTAHVWDAATGKLLIAPLEHQGMVERAVFSFDGAFIATASHDKTARIWDATTGRPLTAPLQHPGNVRDVAIAPDASHIVTASEDRIARVWETRLDHRTLTEWSALADRGPFVLSDGEPVLRASRLPIRPHIEFVGTLNGFPVFNIKPQGAVQRIIEPLRTSLRINPR